MQRLCLPHQFAFRGDRLAFSTGILALALLAALLLIGFKGDTTSLINLYAVGVFLSFTLSQAGMVRHWWRLRTNERHWLRSLLINGLGASATLVVAVVIATTKFLEGAWIVVLLIPFLILLFLAIHKHYTRVEQERTTAVPIHPGDIHHHIIVPVASLDHATQYSISYARSITPQVGAIHMRFHEQEAADLQASWQQWQTCLPEEDRVHLTIIEPGQSALIPALIQYINTFQQEHSDETVMLPEIAVPTALKRLLAHPKTFRLKAALFFRPNIIVTSVSREQREPPSSFQAHGIQHRFLVPIAGLDRATLQSLAYARSISSHVVALHVAINPQDTALLREKWERLQKELRKEEETHLVIIESPYRSLARPLLAYIETIRELHAEETITVILPEFVVSHWWEYPLHNQTAFQLKTALLSLPHLVVTDIPQHLQRRTMAVAEERKQSEFST